MGAGYHQFCPVAKAMELLDERWTLLLVRELLSGSERFNDLRRGLPRMSPTLLSTRLHQLTVAGVVRRGAEGGDVRYRLTPAGAELRPVVEALGAWGTRWIGELGEADLDPKLLLWDMHRRVAFEELPSGRTVLYFHFRDVPGKAGRWWLVLDDGTADVCDADPGHEVTVAVDASLRDLTRVWRGDLEWSRALGPAGGVRLEGPTPLRRAFPSWFRLSEFAEVPRTALTA